MWCRISTVDNDIAISIEQLTKAYRIWKRPSSRLLAPALETAGRLIPGTRALMHSRAERHYRDFFALTDISFQVRRGETIGIIGRNGSGKSTLLQIIAGTLQPTLGTARVNGRVAALLELGSGFNPDFTGRENVYLNASLLGLSRTQTRDRFDEIADFAGIGDFLDQPVKTYSSGMQMRLAFAIVTHVDADLLIIDEALAVGDVFFVQKCMRWLNSFRERGTVLFVTHNARDLTALCSKALWLNDGRLQMSGDAQVVSEAYLAHFNQPQDGGPSARKPADRPSVARSSAVPALDRAAHLRQLGLPADYHLHEFNPNAPGYGTGLARIVGATLHIAGKDESIHTIRGGECVELRIHAQADADIADVIIGFYLKDRLGQLLFGENTFLSTRSAPATVKAGARLTGIFRFDMPLLPKGTYMIAPALASGTLESHIQHHWIHEALAIESLHPYVHRGLIALPMRHIALSVEHAEAASAK